MTEKHLFTDENHTEKYRLYRPTYPDELFEHIRRFYFDGISAEGRIPLALDVACGSGQATVALTKFCARVIGIDVSANQIAQTVAHPNIEYRCESAEDLSFLPDDSVDLITVATALHWFDWQKFFREVERVLKRQVGVLAIWTYTFGHLDNPEADAVYFDFHSNILGPYWNSRGMITTDCYRSISDQFPYPSTRREHTVELRIELTLDTLMGILQTLSGTQTYKQREGDEAYRNLLEKLRTRFAECYRSISGETKSIVMTYSIQLYLMKQI